MKEEQKLRKKLRKVISLTATVDPDGSVWGMDTDCGNIEKLLDDAMKIMKKEVQMKSKIFCPRWGRCKATKKCPLSKDVKGKVYVWGKCANKEAEMRKRSGRIGRPDVLVQGLSKK